MREFAQTRRIAEAPLTAGELLSYEVEGIVLGSLTTKDECDLLQLRLEEKRDSIFVTLDAARAARRGGEAVDGDWLKRATWAHSSTVRNITAVKARKQAIVHGGVQTAEGAEARRSARHAEKMARIEASNLSTQNDLALFKEEVRKRIPPEEYAAIWAAVRARPDSSESIRAAAERNLPA